MENIYSQDEFERNSIVELPDGFAEDAGNTLYSWLGSIWRSIHKGDPMVRGLQMARGIRLAQMYIDILESAKMQDRNDMPVLHRELWRPISIRQSLRDTSQENMLELGMDAELGPQPPGSKYGEGTILKMGRLANFEGYVTYPIEDGIMGISGRIVDNIINPEAHLEYGKDFWLIGSSIIFSRDKDPLSKDSPFEKYDIPRAYGDSPADTECVLWASDVLMDRDYVANHLSYAWGADAASRDVVKRILNAAWSSVASGLTPELVKTLMAAMLNIPVIQHAIETVESIETEKDESGREAAILVSTDMGRYRVSPKATLRRDVFPGAQLVRGSLLDESLRIYPYLNEAPVDMGYSIPMEQDIASVVMPSDILSARTEHGLYAMWGRSVIRESGDGNPNHLLFDVGGADGDVSAFWSEIWDQADKKGVDMASIIGEKGSIVSPAAFFLKNLVGANTIFVIVDDAQLDDPSMMHDPMFFGMLTSVVPSAIRLFVVEHHGVIDDKDLGQDTQEAAFLTAVLPKVADEMMCDPAPGPYDPSFGDRVSARLVRPSPPKVMGRKEEV